MTHSLNCSQSKVAQQTVSCFPSSSCRVWLGPVPLLLLLLMSAAVTPAAAAVMKKTVLLMMTSTTDQRWLVGQRNRQQQSMSECQGEALA